MRKVTKGAVVIKMWDLGGQPRFRSLWERYCRGVQAIVYVVDAADMAAIDTAAQELHALLEKPSLEGIPLLVGGDACERAGWQGGARAGRAGDKWGVGRCPAPPHQTAPRCRCWATRTTCLAP